MKMTLSLSDHKSTTVNRYGGPEGAVNAC